MKYYKNEINFNLGVTSPKIEISCEHYLHLCDSNSNYRVSIDVVDGVMVSRCFSLLIGSED